MAVSCLSLNILYINIYIYYIVQLRRRRWIKHQPAGSAVHQWSVHTKVSLSKAKVVPKKELLKINIEEKSVDKQYNKNELFQLF